MPSKIKSPYIALKDIVTYIHFARQFTSDINFEVFLSDKMKVLAVTRCLEIISEASRRLPTEIRSGYGHINWQQIAAAGNFYRHEYEAVNELEIWDTVQKDLPPLLAIAEVELARCPKP